MSLKSKQARTVAPAQIPAAALIDADLLLWENEVYAADPTGGDPAKF